MADQPDLVAALRRDGSRITRARRAVCQVLVGLGGEHVTVAELHNRASAALVAAGAPARIDPSTVYRTIDALERLGFVHHVHLGHGPGIVHLSSAGDHHHLVCERCGRVVDVDRAEVDEAFSAINGRYGFGPASVHFALLGRCEPCDQTTEQTATG